MSTALCEAIEMLPKHPRKTIILLILNNGYAVKDLAELMNVSTSAVSRYIHDDLSPSPKSLCKLVELVDDKTRAQIANYVAEQLWLALSKLLREEVLTQMVENIADEIAKMIMRN